MIGSPLLSYLLRHAALCALAAASAQTLPAQPLARDSATLDSAFRAHRYPIAIRDGRLEGAGAAFLDSATRNTQFFMVAESHYVAEIPTFTAAWFETLRRTHGVRHFAIEYGPVIGRMLSAAPARGSVAGTLRLGARYPHAFQFWNDEELEALARIGAASPVRQPIWGLDNEWGALHILDRLTTIAPTTAARTAARVLGDRARAIEAARPFAVQALPRFISGTDSLEIDELRAIFRPRPGSESAFLLDALELSNRVYLLNAAAERGAPTGYRSNLYREQHLKAQFMAHYRRAQAAGDALPRVMLKFGSLHGGKWLSRTSVHTLGNFLHEFATANGQESFHLVAWLVNEPGTYWSLTEEPATALLGRVGDPRGWYVVDFRPLRPLAHAGRLRALSPELRQALFAYDAVLLVGSGTRGTYDALRRASTTPP